MVQRVKSYQVALTFAGEQRPLVSAIAEQLAETLGRDKIFYDKYYEAELARPDVDLYLQKIYHDRSRLVVVFLGTDYERKEWCGLEWRSVRDLIKQKSSEQIMLVRVDEGEVPGVLGIDGYFDARGRSPAEIAEGILTRVRQLGRSPQRAPQPQAPVRVSEYSGPDRWAEVTPYAFLSLGSFLAALLLVGLLLWKADLLVRVGLTGQFYYLVLLPLGLSVAGFLFGALRSLARYTGHQLGDVWGLGGPIVGFSLVVLCGFLLPPLTTNFSLTVFVHGVAGPQDLFLRDQGFVMLDLGGERRREPIRDKGQAVFSEVPANFKGQTVNVSLDAKGYELAASDPQRRIEGSSLYLPVRRKAGFIRGSVLDEAGAPKVGATITVAGLTTHTDVAGNFEIIIPGDRLKDELSLQVMAAGCLPGHETVIPGSNDVVVMLKPLS